MKLVKLLVLSLVALMLVGTPVFAEGEDPQDYESNPTGNKQVQLYAEVSDTYTVQLPKKVNVTTSGQTFSVKAKGDIAADKKITISMPQNPELVDQSATGEKKANVQLTLTNYAFDFVDSEINSADYDGSGATETVTVTHGGITAGSWSVDMNVTIGLSDIGA